MSERNVYLSIILVLVACVWYLGKEKTTQDQDAGVAVAAATGSSDRAIPATVPPENPNSESQVSSGKQTTAGRPTIEKPAEGAPTESEPASKTKVPYEDSGQQHSGGLVGRALSEHFASHPSTRLRIAHLEDPDFKVETREGLDGVIDRKDDALRVLTTVFNKVAGELTVEEEWSYGKRFHEQLMKDFEVNQEATEKLTKLARPYLDAIKRTQGQTYSITAVKSEDVNAFAHVGGYIYFYQGLLDLAENDAQLEFVLGHEIGHVERGHCAMSTTMLIRAGQLGGQFAEIPASVILGLSTPGYSEHNEFDADAWSYRQMTENGHSHKDATSFLHRMLLYEKELREKSEALKSRN